MTSLRSGFCVVIAILLSCHGCAPIPSKPLGSESLSPALGPHSTGEARRVVVIAAGKAPVVGFQQGPRSHTVNRPPQNTYSGAAEGAMSGAYVGMGIAKVTFGLGIVLVPVTTVVGAIAGHAANYSPPRSAEIEPLALGREMSRAAAAAENDLNQRLAEEIATSLRAAGVDEVVIERATSAGTQTYPSPEPREQQRRQSADAILQVTLLRVGFEATPSPEYLAVVVAVKVNMIPGGAAGNSHPRTYTYRSADLHVGTWTANDSVAFRHALSNALSLLADQATEDLVLDASAQPAPDRDGTCGLSPLDSTRSMWNNWESIPVLQTRQPTLMWTPFDAAAIRGIGSSTGALDQNAPLVTYDVRLWRVEGGDTNPGPIYSRRGLIKPEHKVEEPLESRATYAWSVRARVLANNRSTVVTPWTSIAGPGDEEEKTRSQALVSSKTKTVQPSCLRSLIILDRYSRFVTP